MVFHWGIFGTGAISAKFVLGLTAARNARAVMVASRSAASANAFAKALGIDRPVEGYAEAAVAGEVDAVYIGTPASEHLKHALLCIEAGIPVLVEKPFATSAAEGYRIAEASRANGVFCMEGMWTRFIPAAQRLRDLLATGVVGEARFVSGSFGASRVPDPDDSSFDPHRGGGALAQLGIYPLSLAQWLFGNPVDIRATGNIGTHGVDEDVAITARYSHNVIGVFHTSIRAYAPNDFIVMGTHGTISFAGPIFRPYGLNLEKQTPCRAGRVSLNLRTRLREHTLAHHIAQLAGISSRSRSTKSRMPYNGNGYHYEAEEVTRCIAAGLTESDIMPLNDSISILLSIDSIRKAIAISERSTIEFKPFISRQ